MMDIKGLDFIKTCEACPEQYDVEYNGKQVGYIRLRWGGLTVEYPDVGGEIIYEASIGDGWTGEFESEEQREYHLNKIADKLLDKINNTYYNLNGDINMSCEEHYFENLLHYGKDINGEPNKNAISKEAQEIIEMCYYYVVYSLFRDKDDLDRYLNR